MASAKFRLADFVALAYALVIVYASLQPFAGWRMPSAEVLGFLGAPWPRYVTAGDVLLNVAAYLPLGAMLFVALRSPLPATAALIVAILIAALLSLALESAQMFLPARIASNLDLLSNTSGAGLGALAAWMLALPALADNPLALMRRHAVRSGTLGDCGLIVVALWILIQFHHSPLVMGNGDLREVLRSTPLFPYAPQSYQLAEAGVVALACIAIGLLISALMQPRQPLLPAIAVTLTLALTAKSIVAATLTRSGHWLQWLTPGVAAGGVGGMVLLVMLLRLPHAARVAAAMLCILAVVVVVNVAPENPYQLAPAFMLSAQPSHLVNFSQIVRALSQVWPLIAVIFLLVAARAGRVAVQR